MSKTEAATTVDNQTKDNKQLQEKSSVKRNREDKLRKKDDKSVDHVLKALSSLETTEEKLGAMCQKYAEMFNDHRILQNAAKVAEKKNCILQKEKEQLQAEHSKAILSRSRLENLCRELQRQNKAVKEECMLKIREEEEKKREVAAKFQSTLTELGNLLAQNNDKNAKLRDDNLDMTTKLKSVCEQYEKKEQHVEKMAKQMHLEMQLANTKLAKAKMEMALEKEGLLRDNQQLLLELKEYKKQLEEMKTSEIALRSQIQLYNDKYDEFHKALLQSNDAIGSFKQEMERMAKQIRKLEKETVAWKRRYETTHRTLLQMTEEKIKSDQTASVSERKLTALQGVCRSLQAQCNHLREVVKSQAATTGITDVGADNLVVANLEKPCEIETSSTETDVTLVKDQTAPVGTEEDCAAAKEEQTAEIQTSLTEIDETLDKTQTATPATKEANTTVDEEQTAEIQSSLVEINETEELIADKEQTAEIQTDETLMKTETGAEANSAAHKEQIKEIETSLDEIDKTLADIQNEPGNIENNLNESSISLDNDESAGYCNQLEDQIQEEICQVLNAVELSLNSYEDKNLEKLSENSCIEIVLEKEENSDERIPVTASINGCANINENQEKLIVENSLVLNTSPIAVQEVLTNGNEEFSAIAAKLDTTEERIGETVISSSTTASAEQQPSNSGPTPAAVCSSNGSLQDEKSTAIAEPSSRQSNNNPTQGKKSKNKRKKSGGTAK